MTPLSLSLSVARENRVNNERTRERRKAKAKKALQKSHRRHCKCCRWSQRGFTYKLHDHRQVP